MPLYRKLPHRGFNNFNFRTEIAVVNLRDLSGLDASVTEVDAAALADRTTGQRTVESAAATAVDAIALWRRAGAALQSTASVSAATDLFAAANLFAVSTDLRTAAGSTAPVRPVPIRRAATRSATFNTGARHSRTG